MPKYIQSKAAKIGSVTFETRILSVLETPALLPFYRSFVAEQKAVQNIDFLVAVKSKRDPKYIVQRFIEQGAAQEINISGIVRLDFKDLFARPIGASSENMIEDDMLLSDEDEDEDDFDIMMREAQMSEDKVRDPNAPDYFDEVFGEILSLTDRNFSDRFFQSTTFEAFCFSILGKPDALAADLGITAAADVERLGQFMIAVEVLNAALIKELGADLAATAGMDLKQLVVAVKGKMTKQTAEIEDTKQRMSGFIERMWQNGSFTIAVKQFLEARLANDKAEMSAALDTAHSIASIAIDPSITKKIVGEEIVKYAKAQVKKEAPAAAGTEPMPTDTAHAAAGEGAGTGARPDLDISLVKKVDWENFLQLYDIPIEERDEVEAIAKIYVKHGEERALASSRKLVQKHKKDKTRKFKFKNLIHFTKAIDNVLQLKKDGSKPKKPLKASQVEDV